MAVALPWAALLAISVFEYVFGVPRDTPFAARHRTSSNSRGPPCGAAQGMEFGPLTAASVMGVTSVINGTGRGSWANSRIAWAGSAL